MKVTADGPFCAGSRIVSRKEQATTPLSKALLEIPGVTGLFYFNDFVTVSKAPAASFDDILPAVKQALETLPHAA